MKKLALVAALLAANVFTLPAHALTATGAFDVTVNLYPKCEFTTAPTALALNYVSFQTTVSSNTMAYGVRCTTSLPYAMSITAATGTLVGINYTLATSAATSTGTGAAQPFSVTGSIAANQSGTCATVQTLTPGTQVAGVTGTAVGLGTACSATSALAAHTLTVTY